MRILRAYVENFGSYKKVDIDFTKLDLVLIHGATGSGKSTLQDIVTWCFYGITSKNGSADDIIRWTEVVEKTIVIVKATIKGNKYTITRIRGNNKNDFYWQIDDKSELYRGKDLKDSQTKFEDLIGISSELYLTAACYNEFSPTINFFTGRAKDRRELFEKITNLSFPNNLMEKSLENKKITTKELSFIELDLSKVEINLSNLDNSIKRTSKFKEDWDRNHILKIKSLESESENFEKNRNLKILALETKISVFQDLKDKKLVKMNTDYHRKITKLETSSKCPQCDYQLNLREIDEFSNNFKEEFDKLSNEEDPFTNQIIELKTQQNYFNSELQEEKLKLNTFNQEIENLEKEKQTFLTKINENKLKISDMKHLVSSLSKLVEFSAQMRAELLRKSINLIEKETNRKISTYFDGELKVKFIVTNNDDLEVQIQKSSYNCSYSQLSKGQKGILKLCFSTSVMKTAANNNYVHFDTIMMDEALDGLDNDFKVKAFNLFSEISKYHSTTLVIDHSAELRNLFDHKIRVEMADDASKLFYE